MLNANFLKLKAFCNNLHSKPGWYSVWKNIKSGVEDFTINGVRFIDSDAIDDIMIQELASNKEYIGMFSADFISSIIDVDPYIIASLQNNDHHDAVGDLILDLKDLEKMQKSWWNL